MSYIDTLKDIIYQAEYGITNWRKLETKEDLINAIKKEVLDEIDDEEIE